jgi:hypothetical protein
MEGTVEDITLIVAKEISTLTIVKVTEVRAQEVCAQEVCAKEARAQEVCANEARANEVRAAKETYMDVDVKEVSSNVSDSKMMAATICATPGQHLPSDITTVIN